MDKMTSFDGSPLIPAEFVLFYILLSAILFSIAYFLAGKFNHKKKKKKAGIFGKALFSFFLSQIILSAFFFLSALFYLFPDPEVIGTSPEELPVVNNLNGKVEIIFDHPVRRKEMVKSLYPYTPGTFVFEDPLYNTHLYRKLVFYPEFGFMADTEYILSLTDIKNFLSLSEGKSYHLSFKTLNPSRVLGTEDAVSDTGLHINDTFPGNGWGQVAVDVPVKITFSKEIDRISAENNFFIEPETAGKIRWEGNTMVFDPDRNMQFNRMYTVRMMPGVIASDGTELREEYLLTFSTSEEVFRLNVPAVYQKYALSCEIASLRMALLYRGMDVSEDRLLADIGSDPAAKNGNSWGNPYVGFVGNVKGKQMVSGYGVFWDPVARAANKYRYAKSFENWETGNLTDSIQKGNPAIVWIALKNGKVVEWIAPSGDKIKSVADEHAVLVTGYRGTKNDPTHIIINDPLRGEVYMERVEFEKKWAVFKNSGVVVY